MHKRIQALGRLKAGTRNKLEAEYEQELKLRQAVGQVAWFRFEGLKLSWRTTRFTRLTSR